ncbi:MAG: hypothetical protein D6761_10195, partial [Candidatus Dadabacteria bacterium]
MLSLPATRAFAGLKIDAITFVISIPAAIVDWRIRRVVITVVSFALIEMALRCQPINCDRIDA